MNLDKGIDFSVPVKNSPSWLRSGANLARRAA